MYDVVAKPGQCLPFNLRWLLLFLMLPLLTGVAGEVANLRLAIEDLRTSFGGRYANGDDFLARLKALEPGIASQSTNESVLARAEFVRLQREALLANPLVSGQPILFVVRAAVPARTTTTRRRSFQTPRRVSTTARFTPGGALKAIDFARDGAVQTLLRNGRRRDSRSGGVFRRQPDPLLDADERRRTATTSTRSTPTAPACGN